MSSFETEGDESSAARCENAPDGTVKAPRVGFVTTAVFIGK